MEATQKINEIEGFLARGNYHAAFNIALSALNECRRRQDRAGAEQFLAEIQHIVDVLGTEISNPSPSER